MSQVPFIEKGATLWSNWGNSSTCSCSTPKYPLEWGRVAEEGYLALLYRYKVDERRFPHIRGRSYWRAVLSTSELQRPCCSLSLYSSSLWKLKLHYHWRAYWSGWLYNELHQSKLQEPYLLSRWDNTKLPIRSLLMAKSNFRFGRIWMVFGPYLDSEYGTSFRTKQKKSWAQLLKLSCIMKGQACVLPYRYTSCPHFNAFQ